MAVQAAPVAVYLPGEAAIIAICAVAEKAIDLAARIIEGQTKEQAARSWEIHIKSLERWDKIFDRWDAMFTAQIAGKETK